MADKKSVLAKISLLIVAGSCKIFNRCGVSKFSVSFEIYDWVPGAQCHISQKAETAE